MSKTTKAELVEQVADLEAACEHYRMVIMKAFSTLVEIPMVNVPTQLVSAREILKRVL